MTPERWRQVEEIYYAVLEKEAGERDAFLIQVSSGDEELGREVESLLAQTSSRDNLSDHAARIHLGPLAHHTSQIHLSAGSTLGTYSIEALLVGGPSDSFSSDSSFHVGISPADGASPFGMSTNVFHELAAQVRD